MAMFSKTCEYAIRSTLILAQHTGQVMRTDDIAHAIGAPTFITGKTLQQLVKKSLLHSVKGPNGGFVMKEGKDAITLMEVVRACDGDQVFTSCFIGLDKCNSMQPCPLHEEFAKVRKRIMRLLSRQTVRQMARQMKRDGATDFLTLIKSRAAS